MKFIRLLLTAALSMGILSAFAVSSEPFTYINPVPSSALHKPETGIILRASEPINAATIAKNGLFTVAGSISKNHSVTVALSEDGRSILLQPTTPFSAGDSVTVIIGKGIKTVSGKKITNIRFYFKVTPALSQPQVAQIAEERQKIWEEDNGPVKKPVAPIESFWKLGLPPLAIWTNTPNTAPGSVFFSNFNFQGQPTEHYCIIDNKGDSIFGKYDTQNFNDFNLNHNGYMTLYDDVDSLFRTLDSNYNFIGTYQMGNGYVADVHEFQLFPNGYSWMLCYDPEPVDMSKIVAGGQKNATPFGCVLQEVDDQGRVIFEWRSWDHYAITDVTHEPLTVAAPDIVHGNSIDIYNDTSILFSSRHLEEVTKINTNTGNIIWRWGGKNNQFKFTNDSLGFSYQHDVRRIANGHITIFDNGNFHAPAQTYAKEYSLDETAKTATLVWSYHRFTPVNLYGISRAMGSVQRLPNGNTFIDWGLIGLGAFPSATEVDSLNNIVWEMRIDSEYDDGMYRAHRYVWTPCSRVTFTSMKASKITNNSAKVSWQAATNATNYTVEIRPQGTSNFTFQTISKTSVKIQNLLPGTTYEWGLQTSCDSLKTVSNYTALATFTTASSREMDLTSQNIVANIYPNPSHGEFSLQINLPDNSQASIRVFNAADNTVYQSALSMEAGSNSTMIDLSKQAPGVYFCQIQVGSSELIKKIIIE